MKQSQWMLLAVAVLTLGAGVAQAKVNFSGEWKLDPAASDFAQTPAPDSMVRVIEHSDPRIHIRTTQSGSQGEIKTEVRCTTDGKECVNEVRGSKVRSVMKWDGDALTVSSRRELQGIPITMKERWTLDGDKLTIKTTMTTPQGEIVVTMAFDKQ